MPKRTHTDSIVKSCNGECGQCEHVTINPSGWLGVRADPQSPMGAGGPGVFKQPGINTSVPTADAIPRSPLGTTDGGAVPMDDSEPPKPPNPPPATKVEDLGAQKTLKDDLHDVDIGAEVVADGKTTKQGVSAKTDFVVPTSSSPGYDTDGAGTITKFKGKFTWKGKITIKTVYGPGITSKDLSCYGRGTTTADVANRDITLGFHEQCHREDFKAYLKAHPLPEPPTMKVPMAESDYSDETARFKKEIDDYAAAMHTDSDSNTDDVGYTEAKWQSEGECYLHLLPPKEE